MNGQRRVVPFIRDLNPQTDDFPALLRLVHETPGDRAALVQAVFEEWTARGARRGFSLHSLEANTLSSLSTENLGIVGPDGGLTDFGTQLLDASDDLPRFKELLGSFLLRERGGWQFAKALTVLRQRGRRPTRQSIATYLQEKYGIAGEWADLNNISSLHSFLEWCGVVSNYRLEEAEFERLLNVSVAEVQVLERFTLETRACLEALVRLGGEAAPGLIRLAAERELHRPLDANQLTGRITPLIEAGLVRYEGRRGARTGRYLLTEATKAEALAAVAADLAMSGVVPDEVFEHDFRWVVERLWNEALSRDERGRTLEVLAGMICTRLGLRNIHLRNTSEFEVDVTADYVGAGGYQTWSAQCKAYSSSNVRSEHVLREFGIAVLDRYSVLLFVTTSDFSEDAVLTADRIVRQTNVQVIRLNGRDLQVIAGDEAELFKLTRQRSEAARGIRLGARPVEVFQELDAARDWLLSERPGVAEVWVYLQRRDLLVDRALTAMLLAAWLETQRSSDRFDEEYLERVRRDQ